MVKLVANILSTLGSRIVLIGISLVSSIVLARVLGPTGLGLFALVLLLPELMKNFSTLGFEEANVVYAGLKPLQCGALVWQSLLIASLVGGVVAFLAGYWVIHASSVSNAFIKGPPWLYVLALSAVPGTLLVEFWQAIIRGMNRISLINSCEIGIKLLSLSLVVIFVVWLQLDVAGAVWADFAAKTTALFVTIVLLIFVGAWGKPVFNQALWRQTTKFALPAYAGQIARYLNYQIDRFIIALLLPPEQLGYYVIAVGLGERVWILPGSVANALLPHLTTSERRDSELPAVISRHLILWVGAVCVITCLVADWAIRLLYSGEYLAAASPLRWLLPGIFVLSVGKIVVAELHAREKPHYIVWASGVAASVNIVGNFLLIPVMGITGAALTSTISYSVMSLMLIRYYLRETEMSWTVFVPRWADLQIYVYIFSRKAYR